MEEYKPTTTINPGFKLKMELVNGNDEVVASASMKTSDIDDMITNYNIDILSKLYEALFKDAELNKLNQTN